jgi:hypothetical protein
MNGKAVKRIGEYWPDKTGKARDEGYAAALKTSLTFHHADL